MLAQSDQKGWRCPAALRLWQRDYASEKQQISLSLRKRSIVILVKKKEKQNGLKCILTFRNYSAKVPSRVHIDSNPLNFYPNDADGLRTF